MNPLKWIKEYFNLTRAESNGLAVAVVIMILFLIFQQMIPRIFPYSERTFSKQEMDSIFRSNAEFVAGNMNNRENDTDDALPDDNYQVKSSYFYFDPNTVNERQMQMLGLSPKVIRTLLNYRGKGGRFYKPDDLTKIYGLSRKTFDALKPYINIAIASKLSEYHPRPETTKLVWQIIEINSADSVQLLSLKGVGPAFAHRILSFRNSLGGFYSLAQLMEVYGMDTLRLQDIMPQVNLSSTIRKIHINAASVSELNEHPYISWKQANEIFNYRKQHGPYLSTSDLEKLYSIKKPDLEKMLPYLDL
jgi:DNA uptake protein ComE-like DNA-binding protein